MAIILYVCTRLYACIRMYTVCLYVCAHRSMNIYASNTSNTSQTILTLEDKRPEGHTHTHTHTHTRTQLCSQSIQHTIWYITCVHMYKHMPWEMAIHACIHTVPIHAHRAIHSCLQICVINEVLRWVVSALVQPTNLQTNKWFSPFSLCTLLCRVQLK